MKPCRIVKSAHRRAGPTLSLKAWAKQTAADLSNPFAHACRIWLRGKREGQAPAGLFKPANGPGPTEADIAEHKRQKAIAANPQLRATDKTAADKPAKRGSKGGAK